MFSRKRHKGYKPWLKKDLNSHNIRQALKISVLKPYYLTVILFQKKLGYSNFNNNQWTSELPIFHSWSDSGNFCNQMLMDCVYLLGKGSGKDAR